MKATASSWSGSSGTTSTTATATATASTATTTAATATATTRRRAGAKTAREELAPAFTRYLQDCRRLVVDEIRRILPRSGQRQGQLYRLMLDYPLRGAKGLRPALAIATCRALGGQMRHILPSAAVLELYHNAFLIHDDVEDESLMRRGRSTLHVEHGIPIAINVGDAMLCLSLEPLLDNIRVLGLGPALRILRTVAEMTRQTVAGQAVELDWMRRGTWQLTEADYVAMVVLKTGWYSFMTPVRVAGIVCSLEEERTTELVEFARVLSVAFQIQDDVLNLRGEVEDYGKEIGGDLWEGKRTVMLIHMLRNASTSERREALRILALSRPAGVTGGGDAARLLEELLQSGEVSAIGRAWLKNAGVGPGTMGSPRYKTAADVRRLMQLIRKHGSLDHAAAVAASWTARARRLFSALCAWLPASAHRDILETLVDYVQARAR